MNQSWQHDADKFECETLPVLKREGKSIGEAAHNGNELAGKIIGYYQMLYRSFDPMTHELLRQTMTEYGLTFA